ncbi:MAG: hypothetical protein WDN76_00245 [Alphaproteobacteria bacterium]
MDVDAIEKQGLAPAKADLAKIAAAKTHEDIATLIHSPNLSSDGPISFYIYMDAKDPIATSSTSRNRGSACPTANIT